METCPKGAKYFRRNTDSVKALIASDKRVFVSIAPSYVGWYNNNFDQISSALKKLGFAGVEETAIGAACVSKEYARLMENGQMKNIIATACSSLPL